MPDNPVRRLSAKRLWNRIERRTRYIESEQLRDWWKAVHDLKNKPQYPSREVLRDYFWLLLFTGLRRNEALCLRWENVNLDRGTLCAVDTKNRSDHLLPMGRYLRELMHQRRRARKIVKLALATLTRSSAWSRALACINRCAKRNSSPRAAKRQSGAIALARTHERPRHTMHGDARRHIERSAIPRVRSALGCARSRRAAAFTHGLTGRTSD